MAPGAFLKKYFLVAMKNPLFVPYTYTKEEDKEKYQKQLFESLNMVISWLMMVWVSKNNFSSPNFKVGHPLCSVHRLSSFDYFYGDNNSLYIIFGMSKAISMCSVTCR